MEPQGMENITKAAQGMQFVCNDIRYSHKHATRTEYIILEGLAKSANELRARLEHFNEAIGKE